MPGMTTRSSLVKQISQLNKHRWSEFVMTYTPLLKYWLAQKQVPEDDREDILQECFMAIHKGISHFSTNTNDRGTLRGWMRIILNRRVADYWRKTCRKVPVVEFELGTLWQASVKDHDAVSRFDSESEELAIIEKRALALIRNTTAEQTWDMFWAYTVENEPISEIAARFGVSESAVRVAKSRVLARLRKLL